MYQRTQRLLERAARTGLVVLLVLWAVLVPVQAQAPGNAEVTHMGIERSDEGVFLTATVRFDLPHVVEEALAKGIPMVFVYDATIFRDRWYWYDKRVSNQTRYMRLAFQPLTRKWRLQISSSPIGQSGLSLGQNFDTRDEAIAAMQRVSRWRIADAQDIEGESSHTVEFRFRLDVSQLPRPFQIGAVGQSEWNISAARLQRLSDGAR